MTAFQNRRAPGSTGRFTHTQVDITEGFGDNLRLGPDDWIETIPLNKRLKDAGEDPQEWGLPNVDASNDEVYSVASRLSSFREAIGLPDEGVYCPVCHIANTQLARLRTPCPRCGRPLLQFGWEGPRRPRSFGDPATWRWSKREVDERFSWEESYDPTRQPRLEEQTWLLIRGQPLTDVGELIRAATVNGETESPYYYTRFAVGLVEYKGRPLIWNNRTSAALGFAGVPRADWVIVDVTDYVERGHPGEAD